MTPTLTARDLAILTDLARFQLLATHQIARRHFDNPATKAAANRLRRLKMFGFVKNVYAPLNSEETKQATRPAAIWFFPPDCQKRVKKLLLDTARASAWTVIEDDLATFNKDQKFAQQSLVHEVSISEIFLALLRHQGAGYALPFLIRTSPRHELVSKTIDVTRSATKLDKRTGQKVVREVTKQQTINPDAFLCITHPDKTHTFWFVEFDNDSSNVGKYFEKLEGYYAYLKQNHFPALCRTFSERYHLGIQHTERASFRVLTIVHSKTDPSARVAKLLAASLKLPTDGFYHFTTLDAFSAQPFGAIFHNKKTFAPLLPEWREVIQHTAPSVQRQWLAERLPTLIPQRVLA